MRQKEDPGGEAREEGALGMCGRRPHSPEKPRPTGSPEASGHQVETPRPSPAGVCVLFGSRGTFSTFESVADI